MGEGGAHRPGTCDATNRRPRPNFDAGCDSDRVSYLVDFIREIRYNKRSFFKLGGKNVKPDFSQ